MTQFLDREVGRAGEPRRVDATNPLCSNRRGCYPGRSAGASSRERVDRRIGAEYSDADFAFGSISIDVHRPEA